MLYKESIQCSMCSVQIHYVSFDATTIDSEGVDNFEAI